MQNGSLASLKQQLRSNIQTERHAYAYSANSTRHVGVLLGGASGLHLLLHGAQPAAEG